MSKKALMILAHETFRDEEYDKPRRILEAGGVEVTVASSSLGEATGRFGLKAPVDILVKDAAEADYEAIVYIGGGGAREYFNDPAAQKLARDFDASGKIVAAICIAPHILAAAGVLKDKRATCFPSESGALKQYGAEYSGTAVEIDGRIITAVGPEAAEDFGEAVLEALDQYGV
jgi:protease I